MLEFQMQRLRLLYLQFIPLISYKYDLVHVLSQNHATIQKPIHSNILTVTALPLAVWTVCTIT